MPEQLLRGGLGPEIGDTLLASADSRRLALELVFSSYLQHLAVHPQFRYIA
jgi:hypothetical protein